MLKERKEILEELKKGERQYRENHDQSGVRAARKKMADWFRRYQQK